MRRAPGEGTVPSVGRLHRVVHRIERIDPGYGAGWHPDERGGMATPQFAERGRIGSRVTEAMWARGRLVGSAREGGQAQRERRVERLGRRNHGRGPSSLVDRRAQRSTYSRRSRPV
jgi:hypothetical protein